MMKLALLALMMMAAAVSATPGETFYITSPGFCYSVDGVTEGLCTGSTGIGPALSIQANKTYTFYINVVNNHPVKFLLGLPDATTTPPTLAVPYAGAEVQPGAILHATAGGVIRGVVTLTVPLEDRDIPIYYWCAFHGNRLYGIITVENGNQLHGHAQDFIPTFTISTPAGATCVDNTRYAVDFVSATAPCTNPAIVLDPGVAVLKINAQTAFPVVIVTDTQTGHLYEEATIVTGTESGPQTSAGITSGQIRLIIPHSLKGQTLYYQSATNSAIFGQIIITEDQ